MIANKYEKMIKRFESRYPHFYDKAVDWWASGRVSIAIKLDDESVLDYNDFDNTIRWVRVGEDADDEAIRSAFGCNLQKFINNCGMSKEEIAEKLGISRVMLSRYMHGKTMPSIDKGYQIAKLMKCSVEELFDDNYV